VLCTSRLSAADFNYVFEHQVKLGPLSEEASLQVFEDQVFFCNFGFFYSRDLASSFRKVACFYVTLDFCILLGFKALDE
jgi:hypothetical protein